MVEITVAILTIQVQTYVFFLNDKWSLQFFGIDPCVRKIVLQQYPDDKTNDFII